MRPEPDRYRHLEGESTADVIPLADGGAIVVRQLGEPYDNALFIHLLSPQGEPLDLIIAGAALTTSLYRRARVTDDALEFTFFNPDTRYRLRWSENARWRLPLTLPTGFRYRSRFARHRLSVEPIAGEERS
jgi:hypothetical protein